MAKIRIYEIAKELKVQSKEVVKFLKEKNINDKVASSSIEGETIAMVRNQFAAEGGKGQKPEAGEKGTGTGKPEPARKQQESPKAGEPQKAGKSQKAGETQKTGEPKKVEETRKEEGARMSEEPKKVTEGKGLGGAKASGEPKKAAEAKMSEEPKKAAEAKGTEARKGEDPKKEGVSQEGSQPAERPKKKASITAVFNPQNSGQHVLGSSLTHAARHPDEGNRKPVFIPERQVPQGLLRVLHLHIELPGPAVLHLPGGDTADGPPLQRGADVGVAVKPVPYQGEEQGAGVNGAAVRLHLRDGRVQPVIAVQQTSSHSLHKLT